MPVTPAHRRAAPGDRQAYVYTKLPDGDFDLVAAYAKENGMTVYAATRELIYAGLDCWAAGLLEDPDELCRPGEVGAREGRAAHVPS